VTRAPALAASSALIAFAGWVTNLAVWPVWPVWPMWPMLHPSDEDHADRPGRTARVQGRLT
jgi:hypothetical protein